MLFLLFIQISEILQNASIFANRGKKSKFLNTKKMFMYKNIK